MAADGGLSSWLAIIKSDDNDIDNGLANDFDGSLSGLGVEMGSNTYNMSEALLALPPVFKQETGPRGGRQPDTRLSTTSLDTAQMGFSGRALTLGRGGSPGLYQVAGAPSPPSAGPFSDTLSCSSHSLSLPDLHQGLGGAGGGLGGSGGGLGGRAGNDGMNHEWVSLMTSMNLGGEAEESGEARFQYVLCAPTSPATRMSEETLTYLNQGQSYEIKLKRVKEGSSDGSDEQMLRSVVRVVFHERRLQYMEKEQLDVWKLTRPGERIVDIDIPQSNLLLDVKIQPHRLNCVEFVWDPSRDTSVFIKVHCISTEFTARKHGGEKGVPFRIQVETYTHGGAGGEDEGGLGGVQPPVLLHCASCQVKVFKPKGADRKLKTDREKIDRLVLDAEKSKYQQSYDCTVLTEIPLDQVHKYLELLHKQQDEDEKRSRGGGDPSLPPSLATPSVATSPAPLPTNQTAVNSTEHDKPRPARPATKPSTAAAVKQVNVVSAESFFCGEDASLSWAVGGVQLGAGGAWDGEGGRGAETAVLGGAKAPVVTPEARPKVRHGSDGKSPHGRSHHAAPLHPSVAAHPSAPPAPPACVAPGATTPAVLSRKRPSETCLSISRSSSAAEARGSSLAEEESLNHSATAEDVSRWLTIHRFQAFVNVFQNFSGSDLLRLYRDDLIQICGLADGIRLYNALQARSVRPRLTLYICQEPSTTEMQQDLSIAESSTLPWDSTAGGRMEGGLQGSIAGSGVRDCSPVSSRSSTPSPTFTPVHTPPAHQPGGAGFPLWSGEAKAESLSQIASGSPRVSTASFATLSTAAPALQSLSGGHITAATLLATQRATSTFDTIVSQFSGVGAMPGALSSQALSGSQNALSDSHTTPSVPCNSAQSGLHNSAQSGLHNPAQSGSHNPAQLGSQSVPRLGPGGVLQQGVGAGGGPLHGGGGVVTPAPKRQIYESGDDDYDAVCTLSVFKKQRMHTLEHTAQQREVYHAVYLETLSQQHLCERLAALYALPATQITEILVQGPSGILILVNNTVVQNFKDHSRYSVKAVQDSVSPRFYRVVMKSVEFNLS